MSEIMAQPAAIRRAAEGLADQTGALERIPPLDQDRNLVLSGMGGSYAVCYAAATALGARGIPALMIDAAELLYFRLPCVNRRTVLVMVSQSGESAEVVRLVQGFIRDAGRPFLVSVTNGVGNTLARAADVALDTWAGREQGPSTMTFGAALVAMSAVGARLAAQPVTELLDTVGRAAELAAVAVDGSLQAAETHAGRLRDWLGDRSILALLARGAGRAASEMGALTLKEVAGFPAEAMQSAQFRHGPLEMVGQEAAVILIATEPVTADVDAGLARELLASGAIVLQVGGDRTPEPGVTAVAIGPIDRELAAAAAIVPIQLLAWRLALDRGFIPGTYRVASKVTRHE